jgi:hypothetical protein
LKELYIIREAEAFLKQAGEKIAGGKCKVSC